MTAVAITFGPPVSCDCCTGTGTYILADCCPTGTGTQHRVLPGTLHMTIVQTGGACTGYDGNIVDLVYSATLGYWIGQTANVDPASPGFGEIIEFAFGCCTDPTSGLPAFSLRASCIGSGGTVGSPCGPFPILGPQVQSFATTALCDPPDIQFLSGMLIAGPCCTLIPGTGTFTFYITV